MRLQQYPGCIWNLSFSFPWDAENGTVKLVDKMKELDLEIDIMYTQGETQRLPLVYTCWVPSYLETATTTSARARLARNQARTRACKPASECTTETRQFKKEYTIGWTAAKHAVGGTRCDHTVQ